jgi:hypothetical protein
LVERQGEVEDLAWVDLALPDAVGEVGQEAAYRCGPAVQVDVAVEQFFAGQGDVVGDADVATGSPNSRASFCRCSWWENAMIRSAPSCLAASTPSRPTAPSPTTATVLPGCTSAATAPNQPVPSTSEAVSSDGTRSASGTRE